MLLPKDFAEHTYQVGSSHDMHSRSFHLDWILVAKTSRNGDTLCSLPPWIQCTSILIERRIRRWRSPELHGTNTLGKLSLILHGKTMCCCRMTSPSTFTTSGTLTTCTPSFSVDWFWEVKSQEGKAVRVLHSREPHQNQEEVQYDLDNPWIAVYKNTWKIHQNTVYWCNLKVAQRNGLQFYQTRSNAIALFNTLFAKCIEKVIYMKTGEELYCKVNQSPRFPRAVFASNVHHGRKDLCNPEARTKIESSCCETLFYKFSWWDDRLVMWQWTWVRD